jgi:hypothetical protein
VSIGARYEADHDPPLERFCRDLKGAEFLAVANLVVRKSFEVLLQGDAAITELRKLVGAHIDIDASLNKYFDQITEAFAAYGQESHSFHECFNRLGELIAVARNQALENHRGAGKKKEENAGRIATLEKELGTTQEALVSTKVELTPGEK